MPVGVASTFLLKSLQPSDLCRTATARLRTAPDAIGNGNPQLACPRILAPHLEVVDQPRMDDLKILSTSGEQERVFGERLCSLFAPSLP